MYITRRVLFHQVVLFIFLSYRNITSVKQRKQK